MQLSQTGKSVQAACSVHGTSQSANREPINSQPGTIGGVALAQYTLYCRKIKNVHFGLSLSPQACTASGLNDSPAAEFHSAIAGSSGQSCA